MADRILKPDTGNDLVLQNDDASAKIEINENGTVAVTGTVSGITASDVGLGNVTNNAQVPATGGTFSGNVSFGDNNITNVGDIAVDTISSDAGTSIGVTLGTDSGDDFNVGSGKLVVEGDTGNVGIGSVSNGAKLDVNGSCAFGDGADISGGHVAIKSDGNGTDGAFFITNTDGTKLMKVLDNGKTEIPGTIDSPGLVVQRNHAVYGLSQGLNTISEPTSSSGVTTSNYPSSGLTTSITPKKTGNKILVICSYIFGITTNATALALIRRTGPSDANSANIGTGGDARKASNVLVPYTNHSASSRYSASIVWEDTAQDTTTSHVYTFCGTYNGTGTEFFLNGTSTTYVGQSTITVLEIVV